MTFIPWPVVLGLTVCVPIVCIWLFARWMRGQRDLTFEQRAKGWEVFVGFVSAMTALVGAALVASKYIHEQGELEIARMAQADREANTRKAQLVQQEIQPLEAKRDRMRTSYDEVKKLAANLAGLPEGEVVELRDGKNRKAFEEMYWAGLIGVEGPAVEGAMVELRQLFKQWESSGKKPPDVEQAQLRLAKRCEEEVNSLESQINALRNRKSELDAIEK